MRYAIANASYKIYDRTANLMAEPEVANHLGLHIEPSISTVQTISSFDVGEVSTYQNGVIKVSAFTVSEAQVSPAQVRSIEIDEFKVSPTQVSISQVGIGQITVSRLDPLGISISTQISPTQISPTQISPVQVNTSQLGILQLGSSQVDSAKVSFSSSVALQQFLSSHNFSLQNTTVPTWTEFLRETTPFNLNFKITDLPSGQLAEASLTSYDSTGRPTSGTLTLDIDGNGLGWFIDSTPWDNSEFSTTLIDTAFRATPGSAAFGRYDLLTTILHETAHLAGFINGYAGFDAHVKTINGTPTFVGNGFTAPLTPDRSHLDSRFFPHDLMNTTLAPGVRKLPSALNLKILETIRAWAEEQGSKGAGELSLTSPLTAPALIGIQNGSFDSPTGWDTRGAAQVLAGQAVLREDSPLLTNFSQAFLIPEGAKALQFTLVSTDLDRSPNAPGDAFEAALLNARTLTPIARSISGLSNTDAFFNLQHSGDTFAGTGVTVRQNPNSTRTVTVDLTGVEPNTLATLYFDLLGFGTREGSVTIDPASSLAANLTPLPLTTPPRQTKTRPASADERACSVSFAKIKSCVTLSPTHPTRSLHLKITCSSPLSEYHGKKQPGVPLETIHRR
ncbi:hypothetical protein [Leptolyngbya sp. FACHB-711]|uniref:hypothetical protein n=1 Tax=Leptolyngbya sp. FACHB-711 TaxID=2692813 RepID=UPI001F5598B8|nr:hypothetical protein [Leptolyngbya sp. FACHB-711]